MTKNEFGSRIAEVHTLDDADFGQIEPEDLSPLIVPTHTQDRHPVPVLHDSFDPQGSTHLCNNGGDVA